MTRRSLLVVLVLVVARPATADPPTFKVIVHREHSAGSIDRELLRNAYLKKTLAWTSGGQIIRPVDLSSVREQFTHDVLKKTPAQLRSYWSQQIFSGKGVPPTAYDSPRAVIAYVAAHPGAVGYIPVDVDPGPTKVVLVK
ncbi:MAG: phosphate ABC transporter substrate-binding protein [Kofleriaceae bacterium]